MKLGTIILSTNVLEDAISLLQEEPRTSEIRGSAALFTRLVGIVRVISFLDRAFVK